VVIDNRFVLPKVVLEAMQRHRVTGFAGVRSTFACCCTGLASARRRCRTCGK